MKYTFIVLLINLIGNFGHAQVPIINGWSQFSPSADSRLIYVSDVSGNDATAQHYLSNSVQVGTDPFLPVGTIQPYKTLDAAKAQLRPGFPDWILFKRGETWINQRFGSVTLSGRSISEPMLIGAYGACGERPKIHTGSSNFIDFVGASASHIAIAGIYAKPHTYTGAGEATAIRLITAPFASFLLEDCYFEYFSTHIAIHNLPSYGTSRQNLVVRRCILNRAYNLSGGGGMFIANVDGILLEENLIDHNGWHESIAGAAPNAFSHNTYFQVSNTNLVFRNNIVARASATGGGFRCGGSITNNLFLANPKNIQFGTHEDVNGSGGGLDWPSQFVTGEVANNVVLDCRLETFEAGTGIQVQRAKNTAVHHNIVAHFSPVSTYNVGAILNEADNIDFHHNTVYNWGNNNTAGNTYASGLLCGNGLVGNSQIHDNAIQINNQRGACIGQNAAFAQTTYQNNKYFNVLSGGTWYEQWFQPQGNHAAWVAASGETGSTSTPISYTAPGRDIATYLTSVGSTGDLPEFLAWSSQNSRCNWDNNRTAQAVNDYIRAGFDLMVSLPVVLLELTAQPLRQGIAVSWTTSEEEGIKGYQVQRSTDGIEWSELAFVAARNSGSTAQEYQYFDSAPQKDNYYRLQIKDWNGSVTHSNIVALQSGQNYDDIVLSPNPATTYLRISSEKQQILQVEIVNTQYRAILHSTGTDNSTIVLPPLEPGIYFARIWTEHGVFLKKWVKL